MRVYHLHPVPGCQDGGYGVVSGRSGVRRVWVPLWRGRGVSVWSALFGHGRVVSVGRSQAVLVQGLEARISYSRWWFFLWLFRYLRSLLARL